MALTYVFDAYCGWCWGLSDALHEYAEQPGVEVEVLSGGLFSGPNAAPIGAFPHMPPTNKRITELTGAQFGDGYEQKLAEGSMFLDSDDAAVGLVALKQVSGGRDLDMARAMQRVFYRDGRSLSDPETYRAIAVEESLDPEAVLAALRDPATAKRATAERDRTRALGVSSYPTLLVETPAGLSKVGSPVSSAAQLAAAVERATAA
jgi:putative protein-disulfide isomerase